MQYYVSLIYSVNDKACVAERKASAVAECSFGCMIEIHEYAMLDKLAGGLTHLPQHSYAPLGLRRV